MVKREQGFKKKHRHGLYYHQLLSSSQFFPQCPSFCMTLMWLVRYDSYHRIYTNNQITKVSSGQISQDSRICSGWTSEKIGFSHPHLLNLCGTDLVQLCLWPLVLPPCGYILFFVQKCFVLTNPPWIVETLLH